MRQKEISLVRVKTLIKNKQAYCGQFVATSTFNDTNVIAHGVNPDEVRKKAEKKTDSPVVFFVPDKDATHIY